MIFELMLREHDLFMIKTVLLVLLLVAVSHSTAINCQLNNGTWNQSMKFSLSQTEVLVSTRYDNVDVIVHLQDRSVSRYIYRQGMWEPINLRTMTRFVKKGDTVLNIGSHIGLQAIVMGRIVGPTGRLFVLQPYSLSFNIVLKNIHLNGLAAISSVYNVGAGNKKTLGYISVDVGNTGGSEIFTDQNIAKGASRTEQVKVDLVDRILPKNSIINFALIDVQRFQVECLQGMKQTIQRSPKITIMCEWSGWSNNSENIDQKKKALLNWFTEQKFRFFHIMPMMNVEREKCQDETFIQVQFEEIMMIKGEDNIFFVRAATDPNTLH